VNLSYILCSIYILFHIFISYILCLTSVVTGIGIEDGGHLSFKILFASSKEMGSAEVRGGGRGKTEKKRQTGGNDEAAWREGHKTKVARQIVARGGGGEGGGGELHLFGRQAYREETLQPTA
jgi:hypothetical protein